jgi:hypothetical protein
MFWSSSPIAKANLEINWNRGSCTCNVTQRDSFVLMEIQGWQMCHVKHSFGRSLASIFNACLEKRQTDCLDKRPNGLQKKENIMPKCLVLNVGPSGNPLKSGLAKTDDARTWDRIPFIYAAIVKKCRARRRENFIKEQMLTSHWHDMVFARFELEQKLVFT